MATVFIGVGSNENREQNIRAAVASLREMFGDLTISEIYQNKAVGFDGEDFYNFVIRFATDMDVSAVYQALHGIENDLGRDRSLPKYSPRTLDLDLLLYDDLVMENEQFQVPRDDILNYAFVLRPLAEIAGAAVHPVAGRTYADLWQTFDKSDQDMQPVNLDLN